ncbi:MAG: hypothetical protein AVDCRST_MAG73-4100, partial [uncultured Thermomicrobiales bacterium]
GRTRAGADDGAPVHRGAGGAGGAAGVGTDRRRLRRRLRGRQRRLAAPLLGAGGRPRVLVHLPRNVRRDEVRVPDDRRDRRPGRPGVDHHRHVGRRGDGGVRRGEHSRPRRRARDPVLGLFQPGRSWPPDAARV